MTTINRTILSHKEQGNHLVIKKENLFNDKNDAIQTFTENKQKQGNKNLQQEDAEKNY